MRWINFDPNTTVSEVIHNESFQEFGELIFPVHRNIPGDIALKDLARAVAFIHECAKELQVDTVNYSVWGGSAGARMAAWLGNWGTESFGEVSVPKPATVIMQYTGLSEVTGKEPSF